MRIALTELQFLVEGARAIHAAYEPLGGDRIAHLHHARVRLVLQEFNLKATTTNYQSLKRV